MINRNASRRPQPTESSSAYHWQLIENTSGDCVLQVLHDQQKWLCDAVGNVCTEQADKVHPPYGWTIRQVFEHCADAERITGYRILRIAAGDETSLSGWDENAYAESRFGLGTLTNLATEISTLRQTNLLLLDRIEPRAWDRSAEVDGHRVTVRALAWIAAGHLRHHLEIVLRRCGTAIAASEPTH